MELWKEDGKYYRREITEQSRTEGRQFLRKIQEFLRANATLVPAPALLTYTATQRATFTGVLGQSSTASVLIAQDKQVPMLVDDLALRLVTRSEFKIRTVSSQTVLARLRDEGKIQSEDYINAINSLVLANYSFLSISSDNIIFSWVKAEMRVSAELKKLISSLEGPECLETSAITVVADVIKKAWTQALLLHQKDELLNEILSALYKGREGTRVLKDRDARRWRRRRRARSGCAARRRRTGRARGARRRRDRRGCRPGRVRSGP